MIREGVKEGTFAPGRGLWPPCPTPGRNDTNFLQEMTPDGLRETRILGVLPQQETKQNRLGCINNSGLATAMKMPRPV